MVYDGSSSKKEVVGDDLLGRGKHPKQRSMLLKPYVTYSA